MENLGNKNKNIQSDCIKVLDAMYAENTLPVVNEKYKAVFIKTLTSRLNDFEKETKRKRVEKVLNKLRDK